MLSYCLFCRTEKCETVARIIEARFDCRAISPKIVHRKWIKRTEVQELHSYLPGYVFLYAETPLPETRAILRIDGALRFLGEDRGSLALEGDDERFAQMLYRHDGVVGIQKAMQEGQRIRLVAGLNGYEAEIVKLDRRRGRAQVKFLFDKALHYIWIGYDLIDTIVDDAAAVRAASRAGESAPGKPGGTK